MSDKNIPLAVLFPGQGSQEKNMGRELAEADPAIMELWKLAERVSGQDLRGVYWDGEEADMAETRRLQPALTVVDIAVFEAARQKISPAFVAGHSLGEFAALYAASVLSVKDILELVSLRGRLMSEASASGGDGAMAALLKLDQTAVEALVAEVSGGNEATLRIANYNTPAQFVISGRRAAVEAAAAKAKELKGRGVMLPVSGAFHSPLMAEAAAELTRAMGKLSWSAPKIPVVFNVTADTVDTADAARALMEQQMTSSVRWVQTIRRMSDGGVRSFLELGPKGVLTRMIPAILSGEAVTAACVAAPAEIDAL